MESMEIRLLGPLEVHLGGRLIEIPRGRVQTLLAALAVSPGRRVSTDTLAEYMWGDAIPETARQALQHTVWRLRRLLGAESVAVDGAGYRLAVDPDAVDLTRFTRSLDRAASAGGEERGLLVEAVGLWRGAPLDGVESETLRSEVVPILTERYLAAQERRIDLDLAAGVSDGMVVELRSLVAEHPIRESLWTRLLRALAASGRDAEALQAYEEIRHELAERLGSDPSEELREQHQRLLTGVGLTDPPQEPAAPAATPRELPAGISGFVGRAGELSALDRLLAENTADGRRPVMTVVVHGAGGVGKTALAVRWAHSAADRFPDGQFYLDLHGYGPVEPATAFDALGSLLRSAGVDGAAIPQQPHERAGLWRTTVTGRRILLLLDNARDANQVRPLLPGADSLVLVTSRSQLRGLSRRDGAASLTLTELSRAEGRSLFTATLGPTRMRQDAAPIDELIDICGGLPLALRIAADLANRHTGAPLAELVDGLRTHRLETLADPDDPAADPRTVLSWSYRRLDPDLARTFRLLGLHPGTSFGVHSAAALLGASLPEARRLLDRLVSVHLLEQPGFDRYRFHDLVREYAAELAAEAPEAETGSAVERCLTWYLHASLGASRLLRPMELFSAVGDPNGLPLPHFSKENDATAWYEAEWSTVIDAVRVAAVHGRHDHAWQLPRTLLPFSELRHHITDLPRVAEVGVASAAHTGDQRALHVATHLLGAALARVGRHDEAEPYLRRALHHAEGIGDPAAVCRALDALGLNAGLGGDHHTAVGYQERALTLAREIGDADRIANCLFNIGGAYSFLGEYDLAIRHTHEALTLWRSTSFEIGVAWSLANLAEMHQLAGRHSTALEYGEQALDFLRPIGGSETMPSLLLAMGRAHAALGDPEAARKAWHEGLAAQPTAPTPAEAELRRELATVDAG
ncbi:MAG: BTAD domain-containing putative transcriptional regulator [Micromonosporaceae bacterium]